jgi:hypothetical protein
MISVEAVMTAPRRPALPQWKIDLVTRSVRGRTRIFFAASVWRRDLHSVMTAEENICHAEVCFKRIPTERAAGQKKGALRPAVCMR